MGKIIFIIVASLLSLNSNAQSQKLNVQFSYNHIIYPFYNYSDYNNEGSCQLDISVTYFLNSRFGISSGVGYELKKFMIDYSNNNLNGWEKDEELFKFEYAVFPIQIEYKLIAKRNNALSLNTGFEFCRILSKEKTTLFYNNQLVNDFSDYAIANRITNYSIGLNYRYHFWENYFVSLSPMLRYNLTISQGIHGNNGQGTALSYMFKFSLGYSVM